MATSPVDCPLPVGLCTKCLASIYLSDPYHYPGKQDCPHFTDEETEVRRC